MAAERKTATASTLLGSASPEAPVHSTPAGRGEVTRENEGRYSLVREFGQGGQSVVYLAYDSHIGRNVAFKQLLPARLADAVRSGSQGNLEARFLREARVTGQLEHPNIVPVYEVGLRADGSLYYTQKLVRGRTFAEAIAGCATLEERLRLLPHFLGICQAVAYAHGRGVLHRDLKPSNVMVGEHGETIVLDWGLAKTRNDADTRNSPDVVSSLLDTDSGRTREGSILGTPGYMSPEQALGAVGAVDERSDVWSLGVILYEILAGHRPFEGKNTDEVLIAIASRSFPRVREACPAVPSDLAAIAERALERDAQKRYPDGQAMLADLNSWYAGGRVGAYDYSPWELAGKFARQHRALSVTAAVALLVLLALAGAFVASQVNRRQMIAQKQIADAAIAQIEAQVEQEIDPQQLRAHIEELDQQVTVAAGLTARLGERRAEDGIPAEIHRLLAHFDADVYALPPSFVIAVQKAVHEFVGMPLTRTALRRWSEVEPTVRRILASHELPMDFAAVAWLESAFDPLALSPIGARGMWQLMPDTARTYGLRVDDQVDERTDVEKSTEAAAKYFSTLIAEMGGAESFMLVLASYNMGESKLRKSLHAEALEPGGWRRDRRGAFSLWRKRRLSPETMRYLATAFATMLIAGDPARYGVSP